MPIPLPHQQLRGIYAALVRSGKASPSQFDVKKYLLAHFPGVYIAPTGPDVKAIETDLKKGPFPTAGMVPFEFGYWYNYFFKELPDIRKIEFAVHVVNDDGTFRNEKSVAEKPWKNIFNEMLALGFKEFQAADKLTADQALEHAALNADNELQQKGVQVVFRGDGRLPDTIKWQGGTARQSRVESLRSARNMDKPWHPFKDKGHKVWVRNGANADNCLFSAVSITPQFNIATKFPLLDDLRGSNPGAVGHSLVMVRPRQAAAPVVKEGPAVAQHYQSAIQQGAAVESRSLLASQTNIYCVRMRDVFNTQNYQGADIFAEYATTRVSWMDHLVWFAVTRIHFSDVDGNAGHLIVISDHQYLQQKEIIQNVLVKEPGFNILQSFVSDVVRRGSLKDGVGGIVYAPPGVQVPFDIVSIKELFIPGRSSAGAPMPQAAVAQHATTPKKVAIPQAFTKG